MSAGLFHQLNSVIGALSSTQSEVADNTAVLAVEASAHIDHASLDFEATARSVVVDRSGFVTSVGRVVAHQLPALREGVRLLDVVHVSDRVAWMRALAEMKEGQSSEPVDLRINAAPTNTPQSFKEIVFAFESAFNDQYRIDVWQQRAPAPVAKPEGAVASEFIAMMSHEFRTPLNAILGFSGLMRHELATALSDGQKREYVELIHGAADHLLGLVNTILDVSKIGAGKYVISRETFDFMATLDEAKALVATQAQAKSVHLNIRASDGALATVSADRRAIKQVLINLLSNAVKFTPDNGCVTVDAWFEDSALAFCVSDTGIGMTKDEQKQIFSPFCQVDNGTTRSAEGTGLGLSLVKGLVGLHGGEVDVVSEPNVGTQMIVRLPQSEGERQGSRSANQNPIDGGARNEFRQSA